MKKMLVLFALVLTVVGCPEEKISFGQDWLIAQYNADGTLLNCWRLENARVWTDGSACVWYTDAGHKITVTGSVNWVSVTDKGWESAAYEIGIDLLRCTKGKYLPKPHTEPIPGVKGKGER